MEIMTRICYVKIIIKMRLNKTYLPKCYTVGTAVNLSCANTNQTQKSKSFVLRFTGLVFFIVRSKTLEHISKRTYFFLKVYRKGASGLFLNHSTNRQTDLTESHLISSHIRTFVILQTQATVKFLFCFCSWPVLVTICPLGFQLGACFLSLSK